jgi:hypothetical protein
MSVRMEVGRKLTTQVYTNINNEEINKEKQECWHVQELLRQQNMNQNNAYLSDS